MSNPQPQINYFEALSNACELLNKQAQEYLDTLPFLDNHTVIGRLEKIAHKKFTAANEDFDQVEEWVAQTIDGWMPFAAPPRNGSLYHALGFSSVSQDAHLRHLLEYAEGRDARESLPFPVLVDRKAFYQSIGLQP